MCPKQVTHVFTLSCYRSILFFFSQIIFPERNKMHVVFCLFFFQVIFFSITIKINERFIFVFSPHTCDIFITIFPTLTQIIMFYNTDNILFNGDSSDNFYRAVLPHGRSFQKQNDTETLIQ